MEVTVDGRLRPLSGARRKTVLAVMALHPYETVAADKLIDLVWGANPPSTALNTLQCHISHLRGVLAGRDAIAARPPGYRLEIAIDSIDAVRAESLIRQQVTLDPATRSEQLRTALALWQGDALSDVTGVAWLDEQAARLGRLRLEAIQALAEARLALGEHGELVPELEQLAGQHPFHEGVHGLLMTALYRSGRQADALGVFRRLRLTMRRELGLDPGPALRELEAAVLRQDADLDPPAAPGPIAVTARPHTPAQLPLAAPTFAGRAPELRRLDALLADEALPTPIAVLTGPAGVGKTTLAVHWAHRIAHRFPDGQLYADLRSAITPRSPARVVHGFLEAFGVPASQIPASMDARVGLFRSVVANRRVLIVLDDVATAEQVRPLLPGTPGCLVLVTSRRPLPGLVAAEGAYPLPVDVPSTADARDLLTRRIGAKRAAAEPEVVHAIVHRCARLPAALAIAGARAAAHPHVPLAVFAATLGQVSALDPRPGRDHTEHLRAVFTWCHSVMAS